GGALQVEQAAAQDGGLLAQLAAKQLQQGVGFGVAHRSLARRASNSRAPSSSPTSRPSQGNTPRDRWAAARPTVAGGGPIAPRGTRTTWPTASTGNTQRSASPWTTSSRSAVPAAPGSGRRAFSAAGRALRGSPSREDAAP